MDDDAAGKVEDAHGAQVAAFSPDHVRDGQINQNAPQPTEPQHGRKLHALGKGTDEKPGGDDGKRHLKDEEQQFRDGAREAVHSNAAEKGLGQAADKGVVGRKGQAVAENGP